MKITIRSKTSRHEVECADGERILYAGLRAGVPLPYECGTGTCGTCKARSAPESVDECWPEAPGRAYLKPDRGEFLMCQTVARGDCEVLVPGKHTDADSPAFPPVHNGGTVRDINRLTHDVAEFNVELEQAISFDAGQFVVIEAPGVMGFRAYSMVNYDRDTRLLQFVIKSKADGGFSKWLFNGRADNARVSVFGPLGKAIFRPEREKPMLCVAGGSGIAGMMSILSRAVEENYFERHCGSVFFGVRTMRDAFFLDGLSGLKSNAGNGLNITVALSDEDAPAPEDAGYPLLNFAAGFVHQVAGEKMEGAYEDLMAFVAGPPPMVDGAIRMLIMNARLPASDIYYDKFS